VDSAVRVRAEYSNHVWVVDFQFDETTDCRRLKPANIVNEFTRETLAIAVSRSMVPTRSSTWVDDNWGPAGIPSAGTSGIWQNTTCGSDHARSVGGQGSVTPLRTFLPSPPATILGPQLPDTVNR
jgi:hypothetical protein